MVHVQCKSTLVIGEEHKTTTGTTPLSLGNVYSKGVVNLLKNLRADVMILS